MRRIQHRPPLLIGILVVVLVALGFACGGSGLSGDPSATAERTDTSEPTTTPETDREALTTLYNATGGPDWSNNTNWLSDAPLDQWHGVTTDGTGRVARLELASNGLSGELPPEIGNLSKLIVLFLSGNGLSGDLPPELGRLLNLILLALDENQFSGELPPELGGLGTLNNVRLEGNEFEGCAPDLLHDASSALDMPKCAVPDHPAEREALVAFYNAGSDGRHREHTPSWLSDKPVGDWEGVSTDGEGRVVRVDMLWLARHSAGWAGRLPPDLGNLSRLVVLDLQDTQAYTGRLSGKIPPELGKLANLRVLHIGFNTASGGLSGEIPSELGNLLNLTSLSLGANQLTGEIPSELGNLVNLTHLNLASNELSGEFPAELGNLSNLASLWLNGNGLKGCVPANLQDHLELHSTLLGDLSFC